MMTIIGAHQNPRTKLSGEVNVPEISVWSITPLTHIHIYLLMYWSPIMYSGATRKKSSGEFLDMSTKWQVCPETMWIDLFALLWLTQDVFRKTSHIFTSNQLWNTAMTQKWTHMVPRNRALCSPDFFYFSFTS